MGKFCNCIDQVLDTNIDRSVRVCVFKPDGNAETKMLAVRRILMELACELKFYDEGGSDMRQDSNVCLLKAAIKGEIEHDDGPQGHCAKASLAHLCETSN